MGKKLGKNELYWLARDFFVDGTYHRAEYGGAPLVQFNHAQKTNVEFGLGLDQDAKILSDLLGIGFFHYGPRLCYLGEVYPLKDLQDPSKREAVVKRIIELYPQIDVGPDQVFYRLRKDVELPLVPEEYDSPPPNLAQTSRLGSTEFPVLYASQDLEVCVHECRLTAIDKIHCAVLVPTKVLKVLDLSAILVEKDISTFESLDLSINTLFRAGAHSYEICQYIARSVELAGFDGIIYPSYFSLLRTGARPFETVYGIPYRRFEKARSYEQSKVIKNIAFFGRPVSSQSLRVKGINRLMLKQATYDIRFGPAEIN